jgi:tetratricopeptide (TPR) repeat protein
MPSTAVLPLQILSSLCQLHAPRSPRSRLDTLIPAWKSALRGATPAVTVRQWRRWQLLYAYWQTQGAALIAHGVRRGHLAPAIAAPLADLIALLAPPVNPQIRPDSASPYTSLFITAFPGGEAGGECQQLEVRQVLSIERFPPLHLSARVADAAILSAGNLAIEALSRWLGQQLALEDDFPLWVEAAFPDTVKLVDESASLAFVAASLQELLAWQQPASAFSGIVRRDTGRIEPVQGFDLPYGKLEAAFDAGVRQLFVPIGTPLGALPQAGIRLQQQAEHHFRYTLDNAPEEGMDIYLLADLDALFQTAFGHQDPSQVAARLEALTAQVPQALPALTHWQAFALRLQPLLPVGLQACFQALIRAYQQAYELSQAGLTPLWAEVSQSMQQFMHLLLAWIANMLISWALQLDSWAQKQPLLHALQQLAAPARVSDWAVLLNHPALQPVYQQWPGLRAPVLALLSWAQSWEHADPNQPDALGAHLRFLITRSSVSDLLTLLQARDSVDLPLVIPGIASESLWLYVGMADGHPQYQCTFSQTIEARPGACPYLPEQLLRVERHFEPCYRQEDIQILGGLEPVTVHLTLTNLSYLPLTQISCQETLPTGLPLESGEIGWSGNLEPNASVTWAYTLAPTVTGTWHFVSPQLTYQLPSPYTQAQPLVHPLDLSHQLTIEAPETFSMAFTREAPAQGMTREPLSLQLLLDNPSPFPLTLQWIEAELLPMGALWQGPPLLLPQTLAPYAQWRGQGQVIFHQPGERQWPALTCTYQAPEREAMACELPAQVLVIAFNRSLPGVGRSEQVWLETQRTQGRKGAYLWGDPGLGKRQLLRNLPSVGRAAEFQGDPYLLLPFQGAQVLLHHTLAEGVPPELQATATHLADFLAGTWDGDAALLKARLFQSTLHLVRGLGAHQPLLWRIYSLAYVDEQTLELLRFLVLNEAPVFLALTGSQAELPPQLNDLSLAVSRVQPLDLATIQAVLDTLFQPHQLPSDLAEVLLTRTQGLPLYLQEYVAWLVQQGYLQYATDYWALTLPLAQLPIPDQLERLILKQFQSLLMAPELKVAAVLGAHFRRRDLAALVAGDVTPFLLQATRQGLLQTTEGEHYRFAQPLYYTLCYRQVQEQAAPLHLQAARHLETVGADPTQIVHHWIQGQAVVQALDYTLRLGEQALAQGAFSAAVTWLEQAEGLMQDGDPELNLRLYRALGDCYRHTDQQARARTHYHQLLQWARTHHRPREQAQAWLGLAQLTQQKEALQALQQAHVLAQSLEDHDLRYDVCFRFGIYYAEAHSYDEGQRYFYQALGYCQPESLKQADVLAAMGYEAIKAGQTQIAENYLLQSKMIYESHQQLQGLAAVYNRLGACCFYQQELARARRYFGESRKYGLETGNQLQVAQVTHNLGLLAEALRDYATAESLFQENLQRAARLQDIRVQGFAHNQLASIYLKRRQLPAARLALDQAQELLAEATDQRGLAYVGLNRGLWALLIHDLPLAQSELQAARQILDELRDIMGQDLALLRLGHLAWLKGELEGAQELYQRCLDARRTLDQKQEDGLERVAHALGLVACARAQWDVAKPWLLRAKQLFEKRREIPHCATVCHNLMLLFREQGDLEQALDYKLQRDVFLGIDREGVSQGLLQATGFQPVLD